MRDVLYIMRIRQWIKNVLVLIPALFAGVLFSVAQGPRAIIGMLVFCFMSSSVYVLNDINDAPDDRRHPIKRNRPIAAERITERSGYLLCAELCFAAVVVHVLMGFSLQAFALLLSYALLNLGYSRGMKNVPLLDVVILSSGYLLRVFYGANVAGVTVSPWLLLTMIGLALYLSLAKRRNEMDQTRRSMRAVLSNYTRGFIDKNMYMCAVLTIIFYTLWTVDPATVAQYGAGRMVSSVPLVIVTIMRYNLTVEKGKHGDPVDMVLSDGVMVGLCLLYVLWMLIAAFV